MKNRLWFYRRVALRLTAVHGEKAWLSITRGAVPIRIGLPIVCALVLAALLYVTAQTFTWAQALHEAGMDLFSTYLIFGLIGIAASSAVVFQLSLFRPHADALSFSLICLPVPRSARRIIAAIVTLSPLLALGVLLTAPVLAYLIGTDGAPRGTAVVLIFSVALVVTVWLTATGSLNLFFPGTGTGHQVAQHTVTVLSLCIAWAIFSAPSVVALWKGETTLGVLDHMPSAYFVTRTHPPSLLELCLVLSVVGALLLGATFFRRISGRAGFSGIGRVNADRRIPSVTNRIPSRRWGWSRSRWLRRISVNNAGWIGDGVIFSLIAVVAAYLTHRIAEFQSLGAVSAAAVCVGFLLAYPSARVPGSLYPQREFRRVGIPLGVWLGAMVRIAVQRAAVCGVVPFFLLITVWSAPWSVLGLVLVGVVLGVVVIIVAGLVFGPAAQTTVGHMATVGSCSLLLMIIIWAVQEPQRMALVTAAGLAVSGGVVLWIRRRWSHDRRKAVA